MGIRSRLRQRRRRIKENERRVAQSEALAKHIDQQWPAVREAVAWAREARSQNHLTELFFAGRKR